LLEKSLLDDVRASIHIGRIVEDGVPKQNDVAHGVENTVDDLISASAFSARSVEVRMGKSDRTSRALLRQPNVLRTVELGNG
jgi:hypothetical protein